MTSTKKIPSIVYVAINSINGKKYIGFTSKGLEKRKLQHKKNIKDKKKNCHFQNAMRKYGFENFNFYTLSQWDDPQEALKEEIRVIALVKPEYNKTLGGQGTLGIIFSEEEKIRLRGRKSPMRGKKFSAEIRKKMSIAKMGHTYNRGKKRTPEMIEANRQRALKNPQKYWLGKKRDPEMVKRTAEKLKGKKAHNRKKIICINDNKIFDSAKEASIFYKINHSNVCEVARNKRKSVSGLSFKYLEGET